MTALVDCRKPTVSVLILAYNQADYIEQAIESVLGQKTTFDVEILVGEDHSTDSTGEILCSYDGLRRGEIEVKVLRNAVNLGMNGNFQRLITTARGKYVALLDGDDFWIGNDKLRLQYEELEDNPGSVCCLHKVNRLQSGTKQPTTMPDVLFPPQISRSSFFTNMWRFHTSSMLWRHSGTSDLPNWIFDARNRCLDQSIKAWLANKGPFRYIDLALSSYRANEMGMSARYEQEEEQWIESIVFLLKKLFPVAKPSLKPLVKERLVHAHYKLYSHKKSVVERYVHWLNAALLDRNILVKPVTRRIQRITKSAS
jgi:glycosyltransferase involved in cell wall biosynthesis